MEVAVRLKMSAPRRVKEKGMFLGDHLIKMNTQVVKFADKKEATFFMKSTQFKEYMEVVKDVEKDSVPAAQTQQEIISEAKEKAEKDEAKKKAQIEQRKGAHK